MVDELGFQDIQSWEPISVIKERVLDHTLFFGSLLALFAFITGSLISPTYAFSPGFYLDIGSISGLFIIYFIGNRISLRLKLAVVILFVFLIFLGSLTQYGTVSTQLTLVVIIPFLCTIAFNFRVTLFVLFGVLLSFALIAYLYISGSIESRIPNPLNNLPKLWITTGIIIFVASSIIILVMHRFNQEMDIVIKKLKKRDQELVGHLDEKNVMIQEIHHRVKNNLAVVSGLLELQVMNVESPEHKKMLQKSVNRILSIAKVHEMLYQSENFNQIPFKDYVDELAHTILKSMNSDQLDIKFESQIEIEYLNVTKGVPLGIIFNELITNSIKYGFNPNIESRIKIHVYSKEGLLHTTYEDNGVGIDDFEEAFTKSLGFSLIESLLSQIRAEHSYQTDNGFKLSFSFPSESD
ncbi:MAG: hypothetical protein JJ971_11560 [Balneolaceae bacterium]|nr:hypothetical protein [Balneolaceae bacterium]MBO6547514.1 hypothetical protein [Balneolaceae bacterium]MBO6647539.1 hypothetical protein [Balneolaceae bacterium]